MSELRYYPFSCGTQFMDWKDRNCDRCAKYDYEDFTSSCEIDAAIFTASIEGDGVDATIAQRMGYLKADGSERALDLTWKCPEFTAIPAPAPEKPSTPNRTELEAAGQLTLEAE